MAGQQCGGRVSVPWTPPQGPVVVPAGPTHSGGGRPFRRSSVARRGLTMDQPPPQFRGPGPKMFQPKNPKGPGRPITRRDASLSDQQCSRRIAVRVRSHIRLASLIASRQAQSFKRSRSSVDQPKPRNYAQRRKEGRRAPSSLVRCPIPESRQRAPVGRRMARRA